MYPYNVYQNTYNKILSASGRNRPDWQTSQQQWARDERDRRAAGILARAESTPYATDAERAMAKMEAYENIGMQGGGLGQGPSSRNYMTDAERGSITKRLVEDEKKALLARQVESAALEDTLENLDMNKRMRRKQRESLMGDRNTGGDFKTSGSYRILGVK